MKTPSRVSRRQSGVALVIVLAVLVLMSALIVGFFSSVTSERNSTQINAAGISARQAADSALNLVMSQIREATGSTDEETTYATQPGAITRISGQIGSRKALSEGRHTYTYNPGPKDALFKLYSAKNMVVDSARMDSELKEETSVIESWDPFNRDPEANPFYADYVDINEPILVPRGPASGDGSSASGDGTVYVEPQYPILDPRARVDANGGIPANDYGVIEGFDANVKEDPDGKIYYYPRDAAGNVKTKQKVPYLPMPVRWLYVLKDGSMAPSENGIVSGATKENPIVSRVAFWTDDETSKLNINTASEGTYWGVPLASSRHESGEVSLAGGQIMSRYNGVNLSASPPVRGEYQRFPGHPATTSLSPVMGWLWDLKPTDGYINLQYPVAEGDKIRTFKEAMAAMSPYLPVYEKPSIAIGMGTSRGGTENPDTVTPLESILGKKRPIQNIPTKHLYGAVDELMFVSDRFPKLANLTGAPTTYAATLNGKLNPAAFERVRGFLTVNSRSSDLNLFGRPRVTIWPVNASRDRRTGYDELFAFTSTINLAGDTGKRKPFYLTRANPYSPIADMTNVPSNDGTTPPNQNEQMYEYLRWLTGGGGSVAGGRNFIPGFGGNFLAKYPNPGRGAGGSDRDQIMLEIIDYIRTVNLVDTGEGKVSGLFKPFTPLFYLADKRPTNRGYTPVSRGSEGSGQVTPIRNKEGTMQGLGRFPMLSEAAMVFYRIDVPGGNGQPTKKNLEAALILEMVTPMPGFPAIRDTYFTVLREVSGRRNKLTIGGAQAGVNMWPEGDLINVPNVSSHETGYGRGFMPILGCTSGLIYYSPVHAGPTSVNPAMLGKAYSAPLVKTFDNSQAASRNYTRGQTERFYPYVSNKIEVKAGDTTFKWEGGAFILEIWSGEAPDDPNKALVQTVNFAFPEKAIQFPMVSLVDPAPVAPLQAKLTAVGTAYDSHPESGWLDATNYVVRGVEYCGGSSLPTAQKSDFRLGMTKPVLTEDYYEPREGANGRYFDGNRPHCHSLQSGHGEPYTGYSSTGRGVIAAGGTNRGSKPPMLAQNINGVQMYNGVPGDWTRGLSKHNDGSFGNKVDEGNLYFAYDDNKDGALPYFRGRAIEETGQSYFSPNRQLPSAVMFGSLPTGVQARRPWQTLLFRPDRTTVAAGHPGGKPPMDHLMLDLFHLPVIEPYAISEPFSTDGRVNLNYRLMPFSYAKGKSGNLPGTNQPRPYIHRDTALRGVLKAVNVMAVPTATANAAHQEQPVSGPDQTQFHYRIAMNKTLEAFEERFNDSSRGGNGIFRSASEICDMDLYPNDKSSASGTSVSNWGLYWDSTNAQTGDNCRERPYAYIYPRVTTKSNVFTVHMWCQTIRKAPNTQPDRVELGRDAIAGEYRGSATIERFIDPNDSKLGDYSYNGGSSGGRLDPYYRFRVINTKHFTAR